MREAERKPRAEVRRAASRERLLHRLWREGRLAGGPLQAEDGSRLRVLFPGWPNGDQGPDFRGGFIATEEGRLIRGDVELHVHARDWRLHGHSLDPAYAKVMLHVVWRAAGGAPSARAAEGEPSIVVALEGGTELPVEALLLAGPHRAADPRPCVSRELPLDAGRTGEVLDREGEGRFFEKAEAFAEAAAARGPEQALYRGLLEALGYSKNQEPFGELAERLPYRVLVELAGRAPEAHRGALLEGLLFGAAGLLPSQRDLGPQLSPWVQELEGLWERHRPALATPAPTWRLFRVRSENSPARRIAAAAGLIDHSRTSGLLAGLRRTLEGEQGTGA